MANPSLGAGPVPAGEAGGVGGRAVGRRMLPASEEDDDLQGAT